jgi:hypothetical protein
MQKAKCKRIRTHFTFCILHFAFVMSLPFEPACLPLMLGSLPYRSPTQALEMSRRYAGALLTWPQLPARGFHEQSFVQGAIGFPGLVLDAAQGRMFIDRAVAERGLDRLALAYLNDDIEYAALPGDGGAGFEELLRQGESLRGVRALKGQLIGPISLAAHLTDDRQRPLIYDEMFLEAICQHLRLRAAWQESRLGERANATIICLDEPFLEAIGMPFMPLDWPAARDKLVEVLGGISGCKALFAGGAVDWSEVLKTSVELIIADVCEHSSSLTDAADGLSAFLERDGVVGFGLVPTDEEALRRATAEALVARLAVVLDTLARGGVPTERLLRQAVITPTDRLGALDIALAERALALLAECSQMLRAKYELG